MIHTPKQSSYFAGNRVLVWFSCGAPSTVAALYALEKYGRDKVEVIYCDTSLYEHEDNARYMHDVERWLGVKIKILRSKKYTDIMDVFRKTGWLVGRQMARCSIELKRNVREDYQEPGDIHIFGYTIEEEKRAKLLEINNPEIYIDWLLIEYGLTKQDCKRIVVRNDVQLPEMYRLGYKNNNCKRCVKGGMGYWNKIRIDFPEDFQEMAQLERELGFHILNKYYLDELPEGIGRYEAEPSIECGVFCQIEDNAK